MTQMENGKSRTGTGALAFSIITVTRNSGKKLIETCKSVACQDADYEHLIIDGSSTDGSRELAFELAAADRRIAVVSEPDSGVYDAMNKGIRLARGRYIYFLGAGDTLMSDTLAAVFKALPPHERAFIYGDVILEGARYGGRFDVARLMQDNICHQAIFHGRDIFKLVGEFDLRYRVLDDWEMNLRCFGCPRIEKIYLDHLIAYFEPGGISKQQDAVFLRDKPTLIRRYLGWGALLGYMYRQTRAQVGWRRTVYRIGKMGKMVRGKAQKN